MLDIAGMKKLFFSAGLVLLLGLAVAAQETADALVWAPKVLRWEHFQEVDNVISNEGGGALAKIYWKLYLVKSDSVVVRDGEEGILVKIYALMIPSLSQVSKTGNRKGVLEHEQLHFDLVEVAAREMRRIMGETFFDRKNYAREIDKLYAKTAKALRKQEEKFDAQHRSKDHGYNWWRTATDDDLRAREPYRAIEVFVRFKP